MKIRSDLFQLFSRFILALSGQIEMSFQAVISRFSSS